MAGLLALSAVLALPVGAGVPAQAAAARNTDFNGDGYNDVAVGSPYYPGPAGSQNSGLVTVLYGGPNGLGGHDLLRPKPDCYSGYTSERLLPCTRWGAGLTSADLDGDGRQDLVSAGERDTQVQSWKPDGISSRRTTDVTAGSYTGGLTAGQTDSDPKSDITAVWESGFTFNTGGWYNGGPFEKTPIHPSRPLWPRSIASGLINGDNIQEMVAVSTIYTYGADNLSLFYIGDIRNPSSTPVVMGSQAACGSTDPHAKACPKSDSKVAVGRVNDDKYDDVVMVTPSTGTLNVWYGDYYGGGVSTWPAHTARDLPWLSSFAGHDVSLAIGDINGDGAAEIAVGDPHATVSGKSRAGAVALVSGSPSGPVSSAARLISLDGDSAAPAADPVPEQSADNDYFGRSVTILDVTGDGKGELIVGAPGKNAARGMLTVLRGTTEAAFSPAQIIHAQDAGATEPAGRFAEVLR